VPRRCCVARLRRNDMGKSELKDVLRNGCPRAFVPATGMVTGAVVEDVVVALRRYGHTRDSDSGTHTTLNDMVGYVFGSALRGVEDGHGTHVCMFDKGTFVPDAKRPEQARRDGPGRSEDDAERNFGAGLIDRGSNSNRDWAKLIAHREHRQGVIRALCRRAERRLPELLQQLGAKEEYQILIDYEETDGVPCVVACSAGKVLKATEGDDPHGWCNRYGEYDVGYRHWVLSEFLQNRLSDNQVVVVDSIDTDLAVIMTALRPEIPAPRTMLRFSQKAEAAPEYLDPKGVLEWVRKVVPRSADPVGDFVRAFVLAGSDYVKGVPGVGNRTFLSGWLKDHGATSPSEHMRRLCEEDPGRRKRQKREPVLLGDHKALKGKEPPDVEQCSLRADWVVGYWRHSVVADDQVRWCVPRHWGRNEPGARAARVPRAWGRVRSAGASDTLGVHTQRPPGHCVDPTRELRWRKRRRGDRRRDRERTHDGPPRHRTAAVVRDEARARRARRRVLLHLPVPRASHVSEGSRSDTRALYKQSGGFASTE
jgi:hypothetical protein